MPIAVQSTGDFVVAKENQPVEILRGDQLAEQVAVAGKFRSPIADLAVLGDDAVVMATIDGEIQVRSPDFGTVYADGEGMAGPGDGIEHVTVNGRDDIVIKTLREKVRIVSRDLREIAPLRQLIQP